MYRSQWSRWNVILYHSLNILGVKVSHWTWTLSLTSQADCNRSQMRIPFVFAYSHVDNKGTLQCPEFTWVLGIKNQVLMFSWQAHLRFSHYCRANYIFYLRSMNVIYSPSFSGNHHINLVRFWQVIFLFQLPTLLI